MHLFHLVPVAVVAVIIAMFLLRVVVAVIIAIFLLGPKRPRVTTSTRVLLTLSLRIQFNLLSIHDSRVAPRWQEIKYDKAVLATGSYPFVPPTPGVDKKGVFVYRTIEDLEVGDGRKRIRLSAFLFYFYFLLF